MKTIHTLTKKITHPGVELLQEVVVGDGELRDTKNNKKDEALSPSDKNRD